MKILWILHHDLSCFVFLFRQNSCHDHMTSQPFSNLLFVHSLMQFYMNCVRDVIFHSKWRKFFFIRVIKFLVTLDFLSLKLTVNRMCVTLIGGYWHPIEAAIMFFIRSGKKFEAIFPTSFICAKFWLCTILTFRDFSTVLTFRVIFTPSTFSFCMI